MCVYPDSAFTILRSLGPGREARGLRLEALECLGLVHDEADMRAGADLVELVLDRGLEEDLASLDLEDADRDLDRHAQQRRREVLDRDLHAHGILAGVGMLDDQLAAGMLNIEDHRRRAVGAGL